MVQLLECDIQTKEVLNWTGLHVLHAPMSSCSQKLRIFLNLKGLQWTSHVIDIAAKQNLSPWFLGINPRGLVPVLVDDGHVHIESNDILLYLEDQFPDPALMPRDQRNTIAEMLTFEDDLHLDLRALSARVFFTPDQPPKTDEDLKRYKNTGSGTVQGKKDRHIEREANFWSDFARQGITETQTCNSAKKFNAALNDLDKRLQNHPFILGDELTLIDIAWVIYAERLRLVGYPLQRLHPYVGKWWEKLSKRPEVAREIMLPPPLVEYAGARQAEMRNMNQTLEDICFS